MTASEQFHRDLEALRNKYPECYIEAWMPEDFSLRFVKILDRDTCERISQLLEDRFDANYGTDWSRIEECTDIALEEQSLSPARRRFCVGCEVEFSERDSDSERPESFCSRVCDRDYHRNLAGSRDCPVLIARDRENPQLRKTRNFSGRK